MSSPTNPHAGLPFDDDDAAIAAALDDVSIPALMCSMVHLSGDPSWIRGDIRPMGSTLNEYQGTCPRRPRRRSAAGPCRPSSPFGTAAACYPRPRHRTWCGR